MQYTKNDFEMIRLLWTAYRHASHDEVTLDDESYSTKHCKTVNRATYEALQKILPKALLEELLDHHELDLIIDQLKTRGRLFVRATPDGTDNKWVEDYEGGLDKYLADQALQIGAVYKLGKSFGYEVVRVSLVDCGHWEYLESIAEEVSTLSLCQVISCDSKLTNNHGE